MTNLIFAFMQSYIEDERESLLLAHNLRKFGGKHAFHSLWLTVGDPWPARLSACDMTSINSS